MTQETVSWLKKIRENFSESAIEHLGIEIGDITDDTISLRMPITTKVLQPFGLLHGGASILLAETAASLHSCWGIDLKSFVPVGIEVSGSHVRSASAGWVLAEARVIRRSMRIIVHEVNIYLEEPRLLLSVARITNFYKALNE